MQQFRELKQVRLCVLLQAGETITLHVCMYISALRPVDQDLYTAEDDLMIFLYNWAPQQIAVLQFEWLAGIPIGNNSRPKKADRHHSTCGLYVLKWQMDVGMGCHKAKDP